MKTVIEMAREVYGKHTEWTHQQHGRLTQLEALIRADERELCAQVVWEMEGHGWAYDYDAIAKAIRARRTHD